MNSIRGKVQNHYEFENVVYKILSYTSPLILDWRKGGADKARDLEIQYEFDGRREGVFVECKFHSKSLSIERIRNTLDWARTGIEQVSCIYLWVCPYLTPQTKDYLKEYQKETNISVLYEEEHSIYEYLLDIELGRTSRLQYISKKIHSAINCTRNNIKIPLEYESYVLPMDHMLLNRVKERTELNDNEFSHFYLTGISGTGKTELAKSVALDYHKSGRPVFWHNFHIENDGNAQSLNFFNSLSYFLAHFGEKQFADFLKEYQCNAIAQLAKIACDSYFEKKPVLFLDDFHKCNSDKLFSFLTRILSFETFDLFFIGWFDSFPHNKAKKKIKFISLDGLNKKHTNDLAHYYLGETPPADLVELLYSKCSGMPYFITLANQMINNSFNDLHHSSIDEILDNIFGSLDDGEDVVIKALSMAHVPLSGNAFTQLNYSAQLKSLVRKKLVLETANKYKVHDTLRKFVRKICSISGVSELEYNILKNEALRIPAINIDLIAINMINNAHFQALTILNENFIDLMDRGFDTSLIDIINDLMAETYEFKSLCWKKAMILERSGAYSEASAVMSLTGRINDLVENCDYEIIYTRARLLYFENKYDQLLTLLVTNLNIFSDNYNEHILMCVLLIARVFYVRADYEVALSLYIYAVSKALLGGNKALVFKSLHRIAMIELCLGMVSAAKECFEFLERSNLTHKRKSYALYRMAQCELKLGNYNRATELNNKSLVIKRNFNHQRGLLYSWNLQAEIILAQGDPQEALVWAQKSQCLAKKLGLDKEEINSGIVLFDIYYRLNMSKQCMVILEGILPLAQKMKLISKIKDINNRLKLLGIQRDVTFNFNDHEFDRNHLLDKTQSNLGEEQRSQIERLLTTSKPITPKLCNVLSI
ncbi:ATP-binding protein [Maridesulfovibrio salexigens]|uniref:TPR repeat-containing protein n=1 Tax=Maridesulfovibrio salexigens (strain ATCC 14822 / DSM 2638 / NCIMB 8403 / VKM B-1763) TaxID=526222 RepID=C6BT29_MARSD|nr:ATP-binding protein [Maridesulfovibrio salexigens]ACS79733.1 TPR repeat-containing protein [Maridesulfovibrio salexigens DSM 2638]